MSDKLHYFAYGSNMSAARLGARIASARLIGLARLDGHVLAFHKPGMTDHSAKCDAPRSNAPGACVYGALYSIAAADLPLLDRFEGNGNGYQRHEVEVMLAGPDTRCLAQTYLATQQDARLRPLDWYKEHVLRGARAIGLPAAHLAIIEAWPCDIDADAARRQRELAIYG